jgi:hypothetical protein
LLGESKSDMEVPILIIITKKITITSFLKAVFNLPTRGFSPFRPIDKSDISTLILILESYTQWYFSEKMVSAREVEEEMQKFEASSRAEAESG